MSPRLERHVSFTREKADLLNVDPLNRKCRLLPLQVEMSLRK